MSFKKIQYENASGVVFQVERETTGFVPFQVTTAGIIAQTADFGGSVTVLGVAGFEVEGGTSTFGGPVNFEDTTTFNGTTTFTNPPSGFVPDSRTIFTSGGLSGGGNLSTNRTFQIANNGVTNAKLANDSVDSDKILDGAVTTDKIQNNAITYNKVDGGDIMRINQVDNPVGYEIATVAVTGQNLDTIAGAGSISIDVTPYVGSNTNAAFNIRTVDVLVRQSGSSNIYPIYYAGDAQAAADVGGHYRIIGGSTNEIRVYPYANSYFDSASFNNAIIRVTFTYIVQV